MNLDREKMRQAYLDGELSASETAEFEAALTPAEREQIEGEVGLEAGLGEVLSRGAACPDALWRGLETRMAEGRSDKKRNHYPSWRLAAAAAAGIVFAVSLFAPQSKDVASPAVVLAAETVDELARMSLTGPGIEEVETYMRGHHVEVQILQPAKLGMASMHRGIEILGAREEAVGNDRVVSLLMACCDHPVKVVFARRGGPAAEAIGKAAAGGGHVQATRAIGAYIAAVVGTHPAHGLLDIVAGQHG